MELIQKYFPLLTSDQVEKFKQLQPLYEHWNAQINVISRKDFDGLYERHVLHSLAIAKYIRFTPGTKVLDVGTGGGFPGIPLAIFFPDVSFHLVDSIGKKIKVVNGVKESLNLVNVTADHVRVEQVRTKFDYVVSRAVTRFPEFVGWIRKNIAEKQQNAIPNGVIYLKGGDLTSELQPFRKIALVQNLYEYFDEEFFETKKLVYLPL